MKKWRQWLLLGLAALLILAAWAWFFRDAIVMYVAPQLPLRTALEDVFDKAEAQYRESPFAILARGYDPEGKNSAHVELSRSGASVGSLDLQADLEGAQLYIRGAFPEESKLPFAALYLNRDFAAVTSDLLGGGCYGITYETFSEDLASIPLVPLLLPDTLKGEWEAWIRSLQEKMDWHISLPQMPKISRDDLSMATLGLWVLCPKVTAVTFKDQPCFRMDYAVTGDTAEFLFKKVLGRPEIGEARMVFYMHQGTLIRIEISAAIEHSQASAVLELGADTLHLNLSGFDHSAAIHTEGEWSTVALDENVIFYKWNGEDLTLRLPEKEPMEMKLSETEKGFQIESGAFWKGSTLEGCDSVATVTRGSDINPPEFKNLDQWSLEDLMIFLNGIWSVIKPTQ